MIGIYKFTSKTTGLSYIGQSIKIEDRYNQHLLKMNDKTENSKWYQALREQGIDNFEFSVLEECNPEELNMREIYWIAEFNSYKNGYNSTPGGQSKFYNPLPIYEAWDSGLSPLEISQKLNIGLTCIYYNLKNYKNYDKHEAKIRGGRLAHKTALKSNHIINTTIYQYDLKGNFIRDWPSCKEVVRNHSSWDSSYIGKVVAGKRKTAYGYQWTHYYSEKIEPYKEKNQGKPKSVIQYDLNWDKIKEYPTMRAACNEVHCDMSLLRRACNNPNTRTASGYKWRWNNEIK